MHPRLVEYTNLIKKIPKPSGDIEFMKEGKLIICLIEFRKQPEIEWVMNAVLRVYKPCEIGIAIVHGTQNADYVHSLFDTWKNVMFIQETFANVDRGTYSALLKRPEFYERFIDFSHILIYQTDALIYRKISDQYFQYDYIGAPWTQSNQCAKTCAGNGGFSLRNVRTMIRVCEPFRKTPFNLIHRGNEDIFFCNTNMNFPKEINGELHLAFAVERVFYDKPIGSHQLHLCPMSHQVWSKFAKENIVGCLYDQNPIYPVYPQDPKYPKDPKDPKDPKYPKYPKNPVKKQPQLEAIPEITEIQENLLQEQNIGHFTIEFINKKHNKWEFVCKNDYEIMFCSSSSPDSCIKLHKIDRCNKAIVHKKEEGCFYFFTNEYTYIGFKGFPNGGESYADIQAPERQSFQHAKMLPKNGVILVRCRNELSKDPPFESSESSESTLESSDYTGVPKLNYVLFTGVGYYNQLFSLETAVFLAHISKRQLHLYIHHPLVHCGRPDKSFGILLDYIDNSFKRHLPLGIVIHSYIQNSQKPKNLPNKISIPCRISNCIFIDGNHNVEKIKSFSHYRQQFKMHDTFSNLFNIAHFKVVSFDKSNASRCFTNFLTSPQNYRLLGDICVDLDKCIPVIEETVESIWTKWSKNNTHNNPRNLLAIHLRFGDWHKTKQDIEKNNSTYFKNLNPWINNYNNVFVITDRRENSFFKTFPNIVFVEDLIDDESRTKIRGIFNDSRIAEFLVQKKLCEKADLFIGSQGSTVSAHTQYINYLNFKPYKKYTQVTCGKFNDTILELEEKKNGLNLMTWSKMDYVGGHPVSWSLFFEDNIPRSLKKQY